MDVWLWASEEQIPNPGILWRDEESEQIMYDGQYVMIDVSWTMFNVILSQTKGKQATEYVSANFSGVKHVDSIDGNFYVFT